MKSLMRLLTVSLALLLMAATSEAQRGGGGFHGGGGGFGGAGGFHGGVGGFHGGAPMPSFRPGFNPAFRPGFNPALRPDFHPSFRPGFNPALRPDFHPAFRPGFNPALRPDFHPGFRPGFNSGFRPGFREFHGRSVVVSPFFGFPFYSSPIVPLDSGSIYTAPTYIPPDQTTQSIVDLTTDDLRSQVGQLTNEVQQLQAELAAEKGQSSESAAAQNAPAVTLILKDGRRIEAPGYALVGSTLWILDPQNAIKISLSDVDADATEKENLKRGINVVIPQPSS